MYFTVKGIERWASCLIQGVTNKSRVHGTNLGFLAPKSKFFASQHAAFFLKPGQKYMCTNNVEDLLPQHTIFLIIDI